MTFGNSPSQIENINFSNKTILHTTSCGTLGISKAKNAKEIICGNLVNAKAIVKYIIKSGINDVSIVSMARKNEKAADEDELCARYLKDLLLRNRYFLYI